MLEDENIVGVRTSNGRELALESYASTLTYTIIAETHNVGAMTRYATNGVQFVEIIERETASDAACGFMRGKIVALGDSRLTPPCHPNCFGGIRPFLGTPEAPTMSVEDPRIPAEAKKIIQRKG